MKHRSWIVILVLLASLAWGLAACGGGAEETTPPEAQPTQASAAAATEVPTVEPTHTPVPTLAPTDTAEPEPTEDVELDPAALAQPTDLSSYRSTFRLTVKGTEGGQEVVQELAYATEYTSEPSVQHITMSGEGLGGEEVAEGIEMYILEDTVYMRMGDQWMSIPSSEGVTGDTIVTPDSLLEDTCGWKNKGSTEIEGVPVRHWTISKEDLEACTPADELTTMGKLTAAGGDLYVAKDGDYVVQMDLFFEGEDLDVGLGQAEDELTAERMEFHFTMTDVNQPFTIQVPEEALAVNTLPEDIPVPDDAQEVGNMFGMITFTSGRPAQEIADFYKEQMPANGWTEVSTSDLGDVFMLEYSKGTRTASFMISTDDTGKTSALITVQEGE